MTAGVRLTTLPLVLVSSAHQRHLVVSLLVLHTDFSIKGKCLACQLCSRQQHSSNIHTKLLHSPSSSHHHLPQYVLQLNFCPCYGRISSRYARHGQTRPLRLQCSIHRLHCKPILGRKLLQRHPQQLRSMLADRAILQSHCRLHQGHPMHCRCTALLPLNREPKLRLWCLQL